MNENIRVAIRMRSLIARETEKNAAIHWDVSDSKYISQVPSGSNKFCFDRVFAGADDNWKVYNELCLPIVQSIMQGFNGTVFAYGQTSSGKTFTMMGEHNGIFKGVIQYAIEDIFNIIETMPEREFLLRVSFLEIYNEKVYDLLSDKNDDLRLMEDSYGIVKVNGLQEQIVQTSDQIWEWMRKCQKKRRTGETQMNRVSSRSHFIFRMIVESRVKDEEDSVVNVSQLNLVDLAGSENLKQTKTKGDRFKEGIHINLSLSTLSQVISQLSEREDQFINYRNSKLTRLLQNSLGGNALTAIICTVTPASLKETLSTLKFASRAKIIKNKPMKNEILNDQALLKQYANKIKRLSQQLEATKEQGKELEKKTKQNEDLKRQIEALKANFVSQTVINKTKALRRETWGGCLDVRNYQMPFLPPKNTFSSHLTILEEEPEADIELADHMYDGVFKQSRTRGSSLVSCGSVSKDVLNAVTQTDPEDFEQDPDMEEAMMLVSELKSELTTLQSEFAELNEYTTLEKQLLKADSELQAELEILRRENCTLREELENFKKSNVLIARENVSEVNEKVLVIKDQLSHDTTVDETQNHAYFPSLFNDNSFNNQKPVSDQKIKEISKIDVSNSSLLDESLKSNFLAFYDECIENEAISKLKSEIESLKYDIELKDKQISLCNDKLQIKEQMIVSLKEEIALGQNIDSHSVNDIVTKASEKVTLHVTCQTDILHSPKKNVLPKECQTSPLKSANIDCDRCNKLNTEYLNELLSNSEKSSNFDLTAEKNIYSTKDLLTLRENICDCQKDKKMTNASTGMSPFKSIINEKLDNYVMENQSIQATPIKLKEVSTQFCKNEINEHYVQTLPVKGFELFSENDGMVDQSTEMTISFVEENNAELSDNEKNLTNLTLLVDQSTQTFTNIEQNNAIKSSTVSYDNEDIVTVLDTFNKTNITETTNIWESKSSLNNSSKNIEKAESRLLQNCPEMKNFIDKINELKFYTTELMKNSLETKYLEGIDCFHSKVEDYSLKAVDKDIVDLKSLIMRLESCIKNREETCEIHSRQLESKFEEVISLKLRLSEAEQDLREKELEISDLSRKIINLHQRISGLAFVCGKLNDIESEEELNSLKMSTDIFVSSEIFSKPEHGLTLIEKLVVKLDSHMKENALKIINLNENLKKAENEIFIIKNEKLKVCDSYINLKNNLISKCVQTNDVINTTKTVDYEKEILQVKNQMKDLEETKFEQERIIKDLKENIANLEASHSAEIDALETEFETYKSECNKRTRELISDLEAKYDQELIDQQNKLTEELHGKILEQKREHLKQVHDLKEEISKMKTMHVKEMCDTKKHFEDQIKDLEEQLFSENSEKEDLKNKFEREKEQLMETFKMKCLTIRNKYADKVRQCQDVNSQLKVKMKHYLEEIEKIKKENSFDVNNQIFQQMEEKMAEISNEKDLIKKRYTEQIKEFEKHINHLKNKLEKVNQEKLRHNICSHNCKEIEETNKKLLYDLDKRKAKIISLESNNAAMIQEVKKLKEMLSSKSIVTCKCRTISKTDQEKLEDHKEKKKCKVEQRNDLESMPENHYAVNKPGLIQDIEHQKENEDPDMQTPGQDYMLSIGGGSGPANMVKCYWLENIINKKDKEIQKLKKELSGLHDELKKMKIRPLITEERKIETKKPEIITPASPLQEINEDITIQTKTLRPFYGAVPKVQKKQFMKERNGRNNIKPYDQPKAAMDTKKDDDIKWQYPASNLKENKHGNKKGDIMNMLNPDDSECKQQ